MTGKGAVPRRMSRASRRYRLAILGSFLGLLGALWVGEATGHPLGNFTINSYSRLDFAGEVVRITYVIDLAEIPTFRLVQQRRVDANKNGTLAE